MNATSDYFDRAVSWAVDSQAQAARSRRTAWIVAGLAAGLAALEAVALAMLVPLKTVQPITLLVDRQTGFTQALDPVSPKRIVADDALTQSLLAQYVMAREGFDRATVSADYRKVALLSGGGARSAYLTEMPATNPRSPFQLYAPGTSVAVRVKSVSKLNPGTAIIRFDTQQQRPQSAGVGDGPPQAWISVVRYRFTDAPMSLEDRLVNPLGFQVLSYRRDMEAPPFSDPRPLLTAAGNARSAFAPEISRAPAAPPPSLPARTAPVARDGSPTSLSHTARTGPVSQDAPAIALVGDKVVPIHNVPMGSPLGGPEEP